MDTFWVIRVLKFNEAYDNKLIWTSHMFFRRSCSDSCVIDTSERFFPLQRFRHSSESWKKIDKYIIFTANTFPCTFSQLREMDGSERLLLTVYFGGMISLNIVFHSNISHSLYTILFRHSTQFWNIFRRVPLYNESLAFFSKQELYINIHEKKEIQKIIIYYILLYL